MSNPVDTNVYSAFHGFAVTPSDSTVFSSTMRAIYVGGSGDVKVRLLSSATLTFSAVPAGVMLPIEVDMVFATGTTATLILALR